MALKTGKAFSNFSLFDGINNGLQKNKIILTEMNEMGWTTWRI